MTALSLNSYNPYANYKKCGEILKSSIIGEKQYALLCLQCHEICLKFQAFMIHIEQEHENLYLDVKTKEEHNEFNSGEENDLALSEYGKAGQEGDEDKKVQIFFIKFRLHYLFIKLDLLFRTFLWILWKNQKCC